MKDAVKACSVSIEAPTKLIEDYFELKKGALAEILEHVKYSKSDKAHLHFSADERRELRGELLKGREYSKHYVDSAINSVIGLVKGWVKLYNRGRAGSEPKITRKTVYIKSTLFSYRNGVLKISIKPREEYLVVDLGKCGWVPRDFDGIGGLLLTEDSLILTLKKRVKPREVRDRASFDVNLTNITALIGGKVVRYDLKRLYHIHRVYEIKRRKVQKLSKRKPKTARKLMEKYSKQERDRARDFTHKLTTKVARELAELRSGAVLENLKNVKDRVLNKSKDLNRRLSKWNARTFQFMLEYKLRWHGLPVRYVNPKNSSRTCPLCSGRLAAYEGRLMKCECGLIVDRDVVAVMNLRM